ncbi:MAG: YjgP/YjgQ family permease [Chthonomonadales bacterium]|nr:YjgP/YjgQ family permease [Chthonomonadales bacterium]
MRTIDRLILRELAGPILNSFLLFLALLFNSVYLPKMTDLMVKGAGFGLVARISMFGVPVLVTQCLPMAMLLGCLLAFGRLSGDSENIAMYASGVSFYRACRPVVVVGLLISVLAFAWNEVVVPASMREFYKASYAAAEATMLPTKRQPIHYAVKKPDSDEIEEVITIMGGYDPRARQLREVSILLMSTDPKRSGQPAALIYADRVVAHDEKGMNADFYDVYIRYFDPDRTGRRQTDAWYAEARSRDLGEGVRFDRDFRGVPEPQITDNRIRSFASLRAAIEEKRRMGKTDLGADEFNLWEKAALPVAAVIFGLVGAPLGVRPQRGSRAVGFGLAIGIIFAYWLVHNGMFQMGKGGTLPPLIAAFAANILGLIAAVTLVARTRQ